MVKLMDKFGVSEISYLTKNPTKAKSFMKENIRERFNVKCRKLN